MLLVLWLGFLLLLLQLMGVRFCVSANYSHWSDKAICTFIFTGRNGKKNLNHSITSNTFIKCKASILVFLNKNILRSMIKASAASIQHEREKKRWSFYWFDIAASDVYFICYYMCVCGVWASNNVASVRRIFFVCSLFYYAIGLEIDMKAAEESKHFILSRFMRWKETRFVVWIFWYPT